jgi:hypothetical protein
MRPRYIVALATLGVFTACNDATAPREPLRAPSDLNASVRTGEKFTKIAITSPNVTATTMYVGAYKQMYATLYYSLGGTLAGVPYAQWSSVDPCIASVTSASPSWGRVKGVKAGKTKIIASAWGKADTITVTVSGTGNTDPNCYTRTWSFNTSDVSFTGTPATSYGVKTGETLKKLVLFAPKYPMKVGGTLKLVSELWYSGGGKLNGVPYVNFSSTNGAVATVDYRSGYVSAKSVGRTKMIVRLGTNMADTVPL